MNFSLLIALIILQVQGTKGCYPKRQKDLTDSFIPASIQVLQYYKNQLKNFLPYAFTPFCGFTDLKQGNASVAGFQEGNPPIPLTTDVCVSETLTKLNLLMNDLKNEAVKQNMEDYQGFSFTVLRELEKTSKMTAAQQLRFILEKLLKEPISNTLKQKILKLIQELRLSNTKFYRNFLNVKALNYLTKK